MICVRTAIVLHARQGAL